MTRRDERRANPAGASAAALVGYGTFLVLGWSSVLIPSLVTPLEGAFGVSDADVGGLYFASALAFLAGTGAAGVLGDRIPRTFLLRGALVLLVLGLAGQAFAPSWGWLTFAVVARSGAVGMLEVGVNALFLALYPVGRGRALNIVHVWFSVGALVGPLAIGGLLTAGSSWQAITLLTAVLAGPVAGLALIARFPPSRAPRPNAADRTEGELPRERSLVPFAGLALAMGCYVAAEVGVSSWVVRYLSSAPVSVATGALSLFWAGLTVGRLASSRVADRFEHVAFSVVLTLAGSLLLAAAVVAPLEAALVLYALAGACFGPIYPLVMAVGGDLYPHRLSALSGGLTAAAFVGGLVYPPLIGLLAEPIGIGPGLLGAALLGIPTAVGLLIARRAASRGGA
jgi:MFS transporter, FHS family, glucose/mannose:H+ symporter